MTHRANSLHLRLRLAQASDARLRAQHRVRPVPDQDRPTKEGDTLALFQVSDSRGESWPLRDTRFTAIGYQAAAACSSYFCG
jgi:hypothetical protein